MAKLGCNIDHVATLRQARKEEDPDPILAARICEAAGAHSIVAHLREDRRHVQDRDILVLRKTVKTKFNLEMSVAPSIVRIAVQIRPDQATIVPERRQEITTEGGLNVIKNMRRLRIVCPQLKKSGIEVSLFIGPDKKQIQATYDLGVRTIELHTGAYAKACVSRDPSRELKRIVEASAYAQKLGMKVNAGHGLNYDNVKPIAAIPGMYELNIGHAIIAQAVFIGLKPAVSAMVRLIK